MKHDKIDICPKHFKSQFCQQGFQGEALHEMVVHWSCSHASASCPAPAAYVQCAAYLYFFTVLALYALVPLVCVYCSAYSWMLFTITFHGNPRAPVLHYTYLSKLVYQPLSKIKYNVQSISGTINIIICTNIDKILFDFLRIWAGTFFVPHASRSTFKVPLLELHSISLLITLLFQSQRLPLSMFSSCI